MSRVTVNRYYTYALGVPTTVEDATRWQYKVELVSHEDDKENPPAKTPEECVTQLVAKLRKLADDLDEGLKSP